jgi:hypothetical protein
MSKSATVMDGFDNTQENSNLFHYTAFLLRQRRYGVQHMTELHFHTFLIAAQRKQIITLAENWTWLYFLPCYQG